MKENMNVRMYGWKGRTDGCILDERMYRQINRLNRKKRKMDE